MKNSEWEFRFYRSGSHTFDFVFGKSGVKYRSKDIETGEWPPFSVFDLESSAFDGLMPAVLQCLSEAEAVDWKTDDEISLFSGKRYKRYMKIEGSADGQQNAAWILAMQASGLPGQCPVGSCSKRQSSSESPSVDGYFGAFLHRH